MAIKLGSTTISKLYLGATEVTKAYLGSTEVYSTGGGPVVNDAFELTVATTAANETFLLPMRGVTSIDVDWGDGTVDTGITSDDPTHVYATAGTHSISVTGSATSVVFLNSGSGNKLKTVTNLGSLGWTSFNNAFASCTGMTSFSCGDCDTSNVTDMFRMFRFTLFLPYCDVSGLDTSSVTNMRDMFARLDVLDRITTLDVSGFDTSNVTNMDNMFYDNPSVVNLDIASFDVTSLIRANSFLFDSNNALTTAQYDAVLIAWAAQSVNSNVTIHFGDAQYTAGSAAETARNTLVSTYGWTITDGGAV